MSRVDNGFSSMIRRQLLSGASLTAAGSVLGAVKVNAQEFGVTGDGKTDDRPAIQAALDHRGRNGGGVVFLPQPKVNYRLASGLRVPSHVTLEGPAPVRYPFNAGNAGACALMADFTEPGQWMIEAQTTIDGSVIPFDRLVNGGLPDGVTYNCGVRNLLLTSKGVVPYGGIRMHGCPGAVIEGVSVDRVGIGLLANYSFGGRFSVHVHTLYYGVVVWDDANANTFEIYCARIPGAPNSVPEDYRLPFLPLLWPQFSAATDLFRDHVARPAGVICGSLRSTSTGNVFDAVIERFPTGILLYRAYATDFRRCYLESGVEEMKCGIAASRSRFHVQALHAYMSGTGVLFELGTEILAKIFGSGILHAADFGKAPDDDRSSFVTLEGFDPGSQGAPDQRGVRYGSLEPRWFPLGLRGAWHPAGEGRYYPAAKFDPWSQRVELRGAMKGARTGHCFTLPRICCPEARQRFRTLGGVIEIAPDGTVRVNPEESIVSLDGIAFSRR